jgi:hypothetical protein
MESNEPPFPELYADSVQVTRGPFGVTLTLLLLEPPQPGPKKAPRARVVGRVRVSPELAKAIGTALTAAPKPQAPAGEPMDLGAST